MSRIAISSGHGGTDPGVVSPNGQKESKTNANVKKFLVEMLEGAGYQVVDVNPNDITIKSPQRGDAANKATVDLYVDIHHNGGGGDGWEIFHQMANPRSKTLAECVGAEFSKINNGRGLKTKPSIKNPKKEYYATLAISRAPAIITEFAFLDSKDIAAVDTLTEQKKEAEAIFNGIKAYFKKIR